MSTSACQRVAPVQVDQVHIDQVHAVPGSPLDKPAWRLAPSPPTVASGPSLTTRLTSLVLGLLNIGLIAVLIWALSGIGIASGELLASPITVMPGHVLALVLTTVALAVTTAVGLRLSAVGHVISGALIGLIGVLGLFAQTSPVARWPRFGGSAELSTAVDLAFGFGTLLPVASTAIGFGVGAVIAARRQQVGRVEQVTYSVLTAGFATGAVMLLLDASDVYYRQLATYYTPDPTQLFSVVVGLVLASALLGLAAALAASGPWGGGLVGLCLALFTLAPLFAPGVLIDLGVIGFWRQLGLPTMVSLPIVAIIFVGSATGAQLAAGTRLRGTKATTADTSQFVAGS